MNIMLELIPFWLNVFGISMHTFSENVRDSSPSPLLTQAERTYTFKSAHLLVRPLSCAVLSNDTCIVDIDSNSTDFANPKILPYQNRTRKILCSNLNKAGAGPIWYAAILYDEPHSQLPFTRITINHRWVKEPVYTAPYYIDAHTHTQTQNSTCINKVFLRRRT